MRRREGINRKLSRLRRNVRGLLFRPELNCVQPEPGRMQRFAAAGWVEYTYRSIAVTDPQSLRRYAEGDGSD